MSLEAPARELETAGLFAGQWAAQMAIDGAKKMIGKKGLRLEQ